MLSDIEIAQQANMKKITEVAASLGISEDDIEPNIWETGIPKPLHMPITKPMTRKFTEPVLPTAARASPPRNLPTIAVSATL